MELNKVLQYKLNTHEMKIPHLKPNNHGISKNTTLPLCLKSKYTEHISWKGKQISQEEKIHWKGSAQKRVWVLAGLPNPEHPRPMAEMPAKCWKKRKKTTTWTERKRTKGPQTNKPMEKSAQQQKIKTEGEMSAWGEQQWKSWNRSLGHKIDWNDKVNKPTNV